MGLWKSSHLNLVLGLPWPLTKEAEKGYIDQYEDKVAYLVEDMAKQESMESVLRLLDNWLPGFNMLINGNPSPEDVAQLLMEWENPPLTREAYSLHALLNDRMSLEEFLESVGLSKDDLADYESEEGARQDILDLSLMLFLESLM